MRDFDRDPIELEIQQDFRLIRNILTLPHRTQGRLCIAALVLLSLLCAGEAAFGPFTFWTQQRLERLMRAVAIMLAYYWLLPFGRGLYEKYPLRNCVDQVSFRAESLLSHRTGGGVSRQKQVSYAALYLILETRDALYLYDHPTDAVAVPKQALRPGELEQLREVLLAHVDRTPPIRREVYRLLR